ncbi:Tat proofreading chaperone DmsD [Adlercreutzia agrestimuris]|uniref:Tat proofreading chaperone DmsD n=1 Tax=Adlercreutzia agrestimuris TaxID=2941324 RepID=UPI00203F2455|nr:Tat proofreading chaperone DmsD [Adlercreutzia agrestimuris]
MINEELSARISLVGDVLAPFFLQDPRTGDAQACFDALATLDVQTASLEWPFVEAAEARADLGAMQASLRKKDTAVSADAAVISDEMMWEYRRLFIGPGKKPAPPWGSVYTDHECVVFGESTLALRAWMRAHGIERMSDERTPEDHIGLMLALLSLLAAQRPDLVEVYLQDHLLTWSSHYLEELEQAAEHPFYSSLAHLCRLSLEGMQDELGIEVTYPKYYR